MLGDGSYYGDGFYVGGAGAIVVPTLALTEDPIVAGETFKVKQDATRPSIVKQLKRADGTIVDLTLASSVTFIMTTPSGGEKVNAAAVITDAPGGWVRYDWVLADTDTDGGFRAEWLVTYSDGETERVPGDTYDKVKVFPDLEA